MDQLPHPDSILALIPCYTATGDCTRILTAGGHTATITKPCCTLIRQLARSLATDITVIYTRTARITQRSLLRILPLTPKLVLVPVKVRKPKIAGDASTGYINFHAVGQVLTIRAPAGKAAIQLTDGREIVTCWAPATVNKQLQLARLVLAQYPHPAAGCAARESPGMYSPEVIGIIYRLVEIFQDIMTLKLRRL